MRLNNNFLLSGKQEITDFMQGFCEKYAQGGRFFAKQEV